MTKGKLYMEIIPLILQKKCIRSETHSKKPSIHVQLIK